MHGAGCSIDAFEALHCDQTDWAGCREAGLAIGGKAQSVLPSEAATSDGVWCEERR